MQPESNAFPLSTVLALAGFPYAALAGVRALRPSIGGGPVYGGSLIAFAVLGFLAWLGVEGSVDPRGVARGSGALGAGLGVALLFPPVAVAGAAAWNLHRRRQAAEPGRARRAGARRAAARRLREAAAPADVAAAVTGYVEDVTGRAAGTVTRGDVDRILRDAGADHALGERCAALLAACERARYGAREGGDAALAEDASRLLDALERTAFRAGGSR